MATTNDYALSTPRSRANSSSSRYIPEGYATPPPAEQPANSMFLAPPAGTQLSQTEPETLAYQPPVPKQYQQPTVPRATPPAQLPHNYIASTKADPNGYCERPGSRRRRVSAESRRSRRSRASTQSRHSYDPDRREDDTERERYRGNDRVLVSNNDRPRRERSSERDADFDAPLKRKTTHRPGYGSSLWALGSAIKNALRGT